MPEIVIIISLQAKICIWQQMLKKLCQLKYNHVKTFWTHLWKQSMSTPHHTVVLEYSLYCTLSRDINSSGNQLVCVHFRYLLYWVHYIPQHRKLCQRNSVPFGQMDKCFHWQFPSMKIEWLQMSLKSLACQLRDCGKLSILTITHSILFSLLTSCSFQE